MYVEGLLESRLSARSALLLTQRCPLDTRAPSNSLGRVADPAPFVVKK